MQMRFLTRFECILTCVLDRSSFSKVSKSVFKEYAKHFNAKILVSKSIKLRIDISMQKQNYKIVMIYKFKVKTKNILLFGLFTVSTAKIILFFKPLHFVEKVI